MGIPNYKDGSIVNLMSSIGGAMGYKSKYNQLKLLHSEELKGSKNIVLLVIDGLCYNYLKDKESVFNKGLVGRMTTVYPPTTAAAITTFFTGEAPQQHGFTGWFVNLREAGVVSTILKFTPRGGKESLEEYGLQVKDTLPSSSFYEKINRESYIIQLKKLSKTSYNLATAGDAEILSYKNLNGFCRKIRKAIKKSDEKKYIYAYWPGFDSLSHKHGINSKETEEHFYELDKNIEKLIKKIDGTDTSLIITADHGLVDKKDIEKEIITLENHPKLEECLSAPLCGDARAAYCYVHPSKAKQFEHYVKTKLNKYCELHTSDEIIEKNYFGLGEPMPELKHRVGDYVLIMKDQYIFIDRLVNEEKYTHVGDHGGLSDDELYVPLIVFNL